MAIPIPTSEPSKLYLGATATWKKNLPDYPAGGGWQVSYYIRGQSGQAINLVWGAQVSASGDDFLVAAAPALMAGVTPGQEYKLYGVVTNGSDKVTFYEGALELAPDPSSTFDARSHVQKVLDAIEATIEGRATREEGSLAVSFGGTNRQLALVPFSDLYAMRAKYRQLRQAELAEERALAGQGTRRQILTRFIRP